MRLSNGEKVSFVSDRARSILAEHGITADEKSATRPAAERLTGLEQLELFLKHGKRFFDNPAEANEREFQTLRLLNQINHEFWGC